MRTRALDKHGFCSDKKDQKRKLQSIIGHLSLWYCSHRYCCMFCVAAERLRTWCYNMPISYQLREILINWFKGETEADMNK